MLRTRIAAAVLTAAPLAALLALGGTPDSPVGAGVPSPAVSYADEIDPIFQDRCVRCHGGTDENGAERLEAFLNLTTYEGVMAGSEFGEVVVPGDADESILVMMVEEGDMPDEGDPLTPEQIELIKTWIAEGAENN